MTFKVIADDEAKREWSEVVDWYDNREPGIGLREFHHLRQLVALFEDAAPKAPRVVGPAAVRS